MVYLGTKYVDANEGFWDKLSGADTADLKLIFAPILTPILYESTGVCQEACQFECDFALDWAYDQFVSATYDAAANHQYSLFTTIQQNYYCALGDAAYQYALCDSNCSL
jgi:hypothetical protein